MLKYNCRSDSCKTNAIFIFSHSNLSKFGCCFSWEQCAVCTQGNVSRHLLHYLIREHFEVKVHAIVITFHPDPSVLSKQLDILSRQVDHTWVIDNTALPTEAPWHTDVRLRPNLDLLRMPNNLGLGAAQNIGIAHGRAASATHVLILDQDSLPLPSMISNLHKAYTLLEEYGISVAAVGPVYTDGESEATSRYIRLWPTKLRNIFRKKSLYEPDAAEVDFLISSGSLISLKTLTNIGLMDEHLFIDHVDTEWCLRAQLKNYKLFIVPSARMLHTIGDRRLRIWLLRWWIVPYYSPFRYYYIIRNSVLLQRRNYLPMRWRFAEAARCFRIFFFYSLFSPHRRKSMKMMLKGLWDGLKGITGPIK